METKEFLSKEDYARRLDDIIQMRIDGHTFLAIGKKYGISKQRVYELCQKQKRQAQEAARENAGVGL